MSFWGKCSSGRCCKGTWASVFVGLSAGVAAVANLNFNQSPSVPATPFSPSTITQDPQDKDDQGSDFDEAANLESFDVVWSTIKKTHWDETRVGKKWDAAKAKYRPLIQEAKNIGQVRNVLEKMIAELEQSHFGIIPASSYDVVDEESGGEGYVGLEIRLSENQKALISRVVPNTPAEKSGVKPGWEVVQIGERKVVDLLKKFKKAAKGPLRVETIAGMALQRFATGDIGEEVVLQLVDGDQKNKTVKLKNIERPGKDSKFGHLPTMRVNFVEKTFENQVGYFRFNVFFDPVRVMPAYRNVINSKDHTNGVVIDLRGNIGGIAAMTMGMARPFVKKQTKLGVMYMRGSQLKFGVVPSGRHYQGKVAVLIDECSISSAEILSGGLQDIGVARVFGRRSAGLALPSTVVKLPNGDGFQYAFADYISEDGKALEKDGVSPDEEIKLSKELLLKDSDPTLTAALKWIHSK